MARFNVGFQLQGVGEVELPVTPLDSLIIQVNGLELATFRFSVQNTLDTALAFDLTAAQSGPDAGKVSIAFDHGPLTLEPAESKVVTATITPIESLLERDVIDVSVQGTEVVSG